MVHPRQPGCVEVAVEFQRRNVNEMQGSELGVKALKNTLALKGSVLVEWRRVKALSRNGTPGTLGPSTVAADRSKAQSKGDEPIAHGPWLKRNTLGREEEAKEAEAKTMVTYRRR